MKVTQKERDEKRELLRNLLPPQSYVWVAQFGKGYNGFRVYAINSHREIQNITGWVHYATGIPFRREPFLLYLNGGNYSKEHEIVSDLSQALYGNESSLQYGGKL